MRPAAAGRIAAMLTRYLYLHKRSLPRTLEIFFWPVMELMVWGFVALHIRETSGGALAALASSLVGAMIFWDLLYRSQQGVSISFVEDIWTQNIINLFVSPLRIWEWITATFLYGLLKTSLITAILSMIAFAMYRFNVAAALGLDLVPLAFALLLFGWALGIFTAALVIRWGHSVEALIWGIPFLIQPFSAIFYPVEVLPAPMRAVALALPSTYVFEGIRAAVNTGAVPSGHFAKALALDAVYFLLAGLFFHWMFGKAREAGKLGRLGTD